MDKVVSTAKLGLVGATANEIRIRITSCSFIPHSSQKNYHPIDKW